MTKRRKRTVQPKNKKKEDAVGDEQKEKEQKPSEEGRGDNPAIESLRGPDASYVMGPDSGGERPKEQPVKLQVPRFPRVSRMMTGVDPDQEAEESADNPPESAEGSETSGKDPL